MRYFLISASDSNLLEADIDAAISKYFKNSPQPLKGKYKISCLDKAQVMLLEAVEDLLLPLKSEIAGLTSDVEDLEARIS